MNQGSEGDILTPEIIANQQTERAHDLYGENKLLKDQILTLVWQCQQQESRADLHAGINRQIAEVLGKPSSGDGSSWHDLSECVAVLKSSLAVSFVQGAQWWEYTKTGATMWPSDRERAEDAAKSMAVAGSLGTSIAERIEAQEAKR